MKRFPALILAALFCAAGPLCAVGFGGKNSFETLSLTYNARFFALAGAGTALVDDVNACLMNSSRLVEVGGLEFSASANNHFAGSYGGQAGLAYPMPFGVFGVSFAYFNYGEAELRTGDTREPDSVWSPSDILAVFSFANRLGRLFSYGINLKYVQEALTADSSMFGFAADLNTFFNDVIIPRLDLGLTLNNLGVITREGFQDNNLPISGVLGLAYAFELEFPAAGIYDIKPCLDFEVTADLKPRVLAGSEFCWYHVPGDLDLTGRVGYVWPSDPGLLTGFRLGAGADFRNFSVDYGAGWMGELGFIHKVSVTFKLTTPPPKRYVEPVSRRRLDRDLEDFNKAFSRTNDFRRNERPGPPAPKVPKPEKPEKTEKQPEKTQPPEQAPAGGDEFDFEE